MTLTPLITRLRANAAMGLSLSPARQLVLADHLAVIAANQARREMPVWKPNPGFRVVQWGERVFCAVSA